MWRMFVCTEQTSGARQELPPAEGGGQFGEACRCLGIHPFTIKQHPYNDKTHTFAEQTPILNIGAEIETIR